MKQYKSIFAVLILCLLACCFTGCTKNVPSQEEKKPIRIVATNFPAYDFARELAGDIAQVTMLVPPGQESHTFEPTPRDIVALKEADLFIYNGGESDRWVHRLIDSAELEQNKTLAMMDCVDTLSTAHDNHKEHDHSAFYEYDEHVWTSPNNAMKICKKIADTLTEKCPQYASTFTENEHIYRKKLESLDVLFRTTVENGKRNVLIFGDRFPFRYFADQYGLSYFAAFPGCGAETEPDAATVKFLIDKVKEEQIPVVLYVELSNTYTATAICETTGAKPALFHSCHGVTKEELEDGENYVSLMEKNAEILKEALS